MGHDSRVAKPLTERSERTTILVFANSFRLGGSERQAVELVRHLDRERFAPVVACFDLEGPLLDDLPADLPTPESYPLTRFAHPTSIVQAARFTSFLHRSSVDVVQTFDYYSNMFAIPVARMAGVPIVVGARREGPGQRGRWRRAVESRCLGAADAIVANARTLGQELVDESGIPEDHVRVIPNGLDLERFDRMARSGVAPKLAADDPDTTTVRVGVLSNLRPEKGHLHLLDALATLVDSIPNLRAYFAGEGPEREAIERRIDELHLGPFVRLLGTVTNAPAFLDAMDVIAHPSLDEGLPNAVIEGMAAGKPIVATRVGGVPELLRSGITGLLVEPGRPDEMAAALRILLASEARRERLGREARRSVEHRFDSRRTSRSFEELYQTLLAAHAPGSGQRVRTG